MQQNSPILMEERQLLRRELRGRLLELADETYKEFHGGLVPGQETILGVRVPKMRALAKDIAKNGVTLTDDAAKARSFTWRQYLEAADETYEVSAAAEAVRGAETAPSDDAAFDPTVEAGAGRHSCTLCTPSYPCYEEVLLQGLVVGSAAMDFPEFLERVAAFVPKIDNWAVCDVFCGTLKATKKHMGEMWDFLAEYLALGGAGSDSASADLTAGSVMAGPTAAATASDSAAAPTSAAVTVSTPAIAAPTDAAATVSTAATKAVATVAASTAAAFISAPAPAAVPAHAAGAAAPAANTEFPIRFAVVMLLSYYIKEDYIDRVLEQLNRVKHEGYYVKMAVAWAISICFIKFPEKTMALLRENQLDDFTYNKAIQKTIESYRVDKETKDILRAMKRK